MRNVGLLAAALLVSAILSGSASEANAQVVFYRGGRPAVVYSAYRPYYATPAYTYYGGWYPGSYMNNYGNYGSYHVMTPVWTGGYSYRYGW